MKVACLPNNVEAISIKMPRLKCGFGVLEYNFNEVVKCGSYDRGTKPCWASSGFVLDCVEVKYTRDVKPVSQLQGGLWINIGDIVYGIAKLATNLSSRIGQNKCPDNFNGTIME